MGDGGSADIHTQEGKRDVYSRFLHCFLFFVVFVPPLIPLSHIGEVCVRVPSSLKARVELCGASVDVSTDVVLHGEVNSTTEDQTTVTGKIFFMTSASMPQSQTV